MVVHVEQGRGYVLHGLWGYTDAPVKFKVQGGPSKDGEPEEGERCRNDESDCNEFPDCPPAGDTGDKETDKRGPGDPCGPVEEGPGPGPPVSFEGIGVQAHGYNVGKVMSRRTAQDVQYVGGWSKNKHEGQEDQGNSDIGLGQHLDSPLKTGEAGEHEQDSHNAYDRQGGDNIIRYPEDHGEAAVNLEGAQSQGCGDSKNRGKDREYVDELSHGSVYSVPYERIKCTGYKEGHVSPETEVGYGETHDYVDCPGMESPVEEAVLHGETGRFPRLPRDILWRVHEVGKGLRHAEEDKTNSHAGREEHAYPAEVAENRFFIVFAQLDVPVGTQGQPKAEKQKPEYGNQVTPTEFIDDDTVDHGGESVEAFMIVNAVSHQGEDDQQ